MPLSLVRAWVRLCDSHVEKRGFDVLSDVPFGAWPIRSLSVRSRRLSMC